MRDVLLLLNEWWDTGEVSPEKAKPYKRRIYKVVRDTFLNYRQIIVLTGLRRVGKTTIIYQLVDELLRRGVDKRRILYFSFDEKVEGILNILGEYSKITKIDWRRERVYLFLDEIHKLEGWSSKLKILYDSLPNVKILVTGSASLMVEREAKRNLAGRHFPVELKPLSLREFAELYYQRRIEDFNIYMPKLRAIFEDYIRRPFPEIVRWDDRAKVNMYIRELVVEKMEKSDIPTIFKRINIHLLSTLTEIFMRDVGAILNITSLARDLGVHKLTLARHIEYLKYGKLIRTVENYRPSTRATSRKNRKVYPYHIALSYCFYPELTRGQILESLTATALDLDKYWRKNSREIDFIKTNRETTPIKVKAGKTVGRKDVKNLLKFMEKYKVGRGVIIYNGDTHQRIKIDEKEIELKPILKILF